MRIRSKKPTKQRSTSLDFSALCSSNLKSTLQLTPRKRGQEPVRVPVHFERPQHLLQMRVLLCGHQLKLRHGQATRLESGGQPPTGVEQPGRLLPSAYRIIPALEVSPSSVSGANLDDANDLGRCRRDRGHFGLAHHLAGCRDVCCQSRHLIDALVIDAARQEEF